MEPKVESFEGTGSEIASYAGAHPEEHFVLTKAPSASHSKGHDPKGWEEAMKIFESFRGKLPILPADATSTDSLYD